MSFFGLSLRMIVGLRVRLVVCIGGVLVGIGGLGVGGRIRLRFPVPLVSVISGHRALDVVASVAVVCVEVAVGFENAVYVEIGIFDRVIVMDFPKFSKYFAV